MGAVMRPMPIDKLTMMFMMVRMRVACQYRSPGQTKPTKVRK